MSYTFKKTVIVTGHYGSGKTNLAVNIALSLPGCTIADLDIVNPYFRTADFADLLEERGVRLSVSRYANSNLDLPSLAFGLDGLSGNDARFVLDVGGDDAGAAALGRYNHLLKDGGYDLLYVVNARRFLTKEPADAIVLLREIEEASHLKCTAIVNNTNLGRETTAETVTASLPYAKETARIANLPLLFTAANRALFTEKPDFDYFPVDIFVKTID